VRHANVQSVQGLRPESPSGRIAPGLIPGDGLAPLASRLLLTGGAGCEVRSRAELYMNIIMLIKTVFVTAIFLLLVLIGLNNSAPVDFNLPLLFSSAVKQPAAIMYFSFFAVGLITGAVLSIGIRKSSRQG
jgi:uncharacterized integral membrane protein